MASWIRYKSFTRTVASCLRNIHEQEKVKNAVLKRCVSTFKQDPIKNFAPIGIATGIAVTGLGLYLILKPNECKALTKSSTPTKIFTKKDVAAHNCIETGIWVTYNGHVYDITEFVSLHPGGDKIYLAAGGALEPFWNLYAVHKEPGILKMLEKYHIGELSPADRAKPEKVDDHFVNDPERHPVLIVNSEKPFNSEPPLSILADNMITPNEIFFVRNHLPVPIVDKKKYKLEVCGIDNKCVNLSLDDLKRKFKKHEIHAVIQCGGNRRAEMSKTKEVKGLVWKGAAISNAKWGGAKLVDVLNYAGVKDDERIQHVQFEGYDKDPTSNNTFYGSSVPKGVGMNPHRDLLIAYEMNDEEIPIDHGFPVRVVIPGVVGARSVKWLKKVVVSAEESKSHWQQNDYKTFNPSVELGKGDFSKSKAIIDMPVQSAICTPRPNSVLEDYEEVTVKGYAWSGGGNGINRVDVSADGGKTWHTAELNQENQPYSQCWAWTLWEAEVPIPKDHKGNIEIVCKAVDSGHGVQPDTVDGIWNFRGLCNNSWHRINVKVPKE